MGRPFQGNASHDSVGAVRPAGADGLVLRAGCFGTLGHACLPENANCRTRQRGLGIYDIHHNRVVSSVCDLPFGPGERFLDKDGVETSVLGGWYSSSVSVFHSNNPLTETVNRSLT
jgi:hypothetical protein